MAYEVTATRRRPQKFEDLIGQEFVAETLRNSIQSGKIAHAYLFSGPRGCGKTSTARILAKALNCEKGPTATPCGTCSSCVEITKGSSLDVIEIDGASNTSVNDVRQIKDEVLFPPNASRYKIYIIDEVHMLSTSAFNALLKTIEEPPPYVIFIFATTELQKVPATIKSRCQQFNFRLVPIEKVKEQLAKAAEEINLKVDDEALYWVARESTGSMRDAYTLFDQVAAFSDGELTYDKIRDKLGLVGVDRLNELFTLCAKEDSSEALTKIDEYLQNGVSIEQLISNCTDYLRSLLLIKNGITKEALLGQASERFAPLVIESWNSIQIERALDIFLQLYRDIRYSLNQRYELELAVSRLCWLKEYVSAAEVKRAVDAVKPLLAGSSAGQPTERHVVASQMPIQQTVPQQSVSQQAAGTQPVYVPHFSAMDDAQKEGGSQTEAHSFHDGGAVPPVNKTAAGDTISDSFCMSDSAASPAPAVSVVQSAVAQRTMPVQNEYTERTDTSESYDAEEGSYAPDDFDEDVSDAEQGSVVHADNAPQTQMPDVATEVPAEVIASVQEHSYSNDNQLNALCASMISEFSVTDPLAASALSQTKDWKSTGGEITAVTEEAFVKMQLQNSAARITSYLSEKTARQVTFAIQYVEKKESGEKKELPIEVQLLCNTFRGTLIAG